MATTDRRSVLRAIGIGTGSAVAGCLGSGSDANASVAAIETSYPTVAGAQYYVHGGPVDDPDEPPVRFESLPPQARLDAANGIVRPWYVTSRSPEILDWDRRPVAYRGTPFTVGAGVADGVHRRDPDALELVSIDATVVGSELEVALTNELEDALTVAHYGRPCFGVLTAVSGSTTLLDHELYGTNAAVRTNDVVRTEQFPSRDRTETIAPGESLRESYRIRESLPDESTVWLSVPIETAVYSEIVTGTISLEA